MQFQIDVLNREFHPVKMRILPYFAGTLQVNNRIFSIII